MKISKLYAILAVVLLLFSSISYAQKSKDIGPKFDVADFNKKFEIVQWLVEYDEVAWKTSDVVVTEDKAEIAKLGTEWFCFQDDKRLWHAVYGKLADDKFQPVFHYTLDSGSKIARSTEKLDQKSLDAYANALSTAKVKLKASLAKNSPLFNQYIRKETDGTLGVWMLPAFQSDGTAVFGGEAFYSIDSTGTKILKEESYFQPSFRGFKTAPPREIWLNYQELEKPTLGTIFFVWYYKSYFTNIIIDNAHSTSSIVNAGKDGYIWVHVEKDDKKPAKSVGE
jgi:hypothetical protein